MKTTFRSLFARFRQLWRLEEGIAAVEFALILPIMLLVYIGSIEASNLISMDRRIQSVAGAVGDLVARSDSTISPTILEDYFLAARGIMSPFPVGGVQQVVTQVNVTLEGVATVGWSRHYINGKYGVGTEYLKTKPFELPEAMIAIAKGQSVIVAKATYLYPPFYGFVIDKPVQLSRENFFMPRFGGSISEP